MDSAKVSARQRDKRLALPDWLAGETVDAEHRPCERGRHSDARIDRRNYGRRECCDYAFRRLADVRQLNIKLFDLLRLYDEFLRKQNGRINAREKGSSQEQRWQA